MNKPTSNLINIAATGFIVLVLLSLLFFWGRFLCVVRLITNMSAGSSLITISPSGLVPDEPAPKRAGYEAFPIHNRPPGPNEPNFLFSGIYANISKEIVFSKAIGAFWDIAAEMSPYYDVNERVYYRYDKENGRYICLDKSSGLIICHNKYFEPNDKSVLRGTDFFAGPNGISKTADSSLGRFYDPIVTEGWDLNRICLYDKKSRCFYVIDFAGGSVSKGLQLAQGDRREPVAIGGGIANELSIVSGVGCIPPQIWSAEKDDWKPRGVFLPGSNEEYTFTDWDLTYTYIPVLDKTGQIHIYNTSKQSLTQVGHLPMPQSLFMGERRNDVAMPRDVLAYQIQPFYAVLRSLREGKKAGRVIDTKYLGMGVACVSREGMEMALAVFDPNGRMIYRGDTDTTTSNEPTPLVATVLLLLENLQPVAFEAASYLCGDYFEPSPGHRALFILPNSFVGMFGRGTDEKLAVRPFGALLFMGPSLILSVWLAFRVRKDATIVGLSGTAKRWWMAGTIAFGLSAYITYRLTRPKETLVTCQNCGNMRRPDMERCHRCGSKWEMPELTPPNWRICD
jgi:hypothetical protein